MEAQGLGPTVTISLPILPKRGEIVWTQQGLAGIAGTYSSFFFIKLSFQPLILG